MLKSKRSIGEVHDASSDAMKDRTKDKQKSVGRGRL